MVGVLDHRYDEVSAGQCGCHADVDVAFANDVVAAHLHVHHGHLLDGLHNGLDEYRGEGELFSFALLEGFLDAFAPEHQVGHIGLHEAGYVGAGVLAHHHVVGDEPSHAVHFDHLVAGCWHQGGSGRRSRG